MGKLIAASENDWSGNTSYYLDEDGNRLSIGVGDLPKFLKDSETAGRKLEKIPTVKFQDRQGNDFIVPEDRTRDFLYESAANKRDVARIQTWENEKGESYDMPMWKEKGDYGLREKGFRPSEEWGEGGNVRKKDFINAVNHAFTHAEDWGFRRNEDGSVDVADTAGEVGGRLVRGTIGGAASVAEGLGFGLVRAGLGMAGVQSRALGSVAKLGEAAGIPGAGKAAEALTGWQGKANAVLEGAQEKTRNWVIDNILGETVTQGTQFGKDLSATGMKVGETYGDMRLALGALGKLGKAAIPMAFGAEAVERTIEDPTMQQEDGAATSAVAVVNGVANSLFMGAFGKLMHAYALKGAAKTMQKTFGKALAIALGESVAGGADMGLIEGANQLARGVVGVEDQGVDANGKPTDDPDKIVAMRAATPEERVSRATNALLHGTLMTLGLKAAELSPRIAYSGRGMTKAVSFDVENARREYAPKVARVAKAAGALQMNGEAVPKGPWFNDVKAVTTNGEVVMKDGSVYYPATKDRNVTVAGQNGQQSVATIKGREARIVVTDGTILNEKGDVVGKLAGGQRLGRSVDTQAEAYARASDPQAGTGLVNVFDRSTGRAADIPTNILDLAPESYRSYNKWLLAGNTFQAPELDADGLAFARIVGHYRVGGDARHAAEMALGDVANGRKTMREAADLLDSVERQMRGEPESDVLASERSGDSPEERKSGVVTPTAGEVKVETTPRPNGELPRETVEAAADLHEMGKLDVIKTEDVPVAAIETSPTEGAGVQDVTPAKATPTEHAPIMLRLNPETGKLEPIDGNKRIAAEKAKGAKTVKAVVLHEEDGWTPENAEAVKLVGNVTSGSLDAKGMVDAFGKLGIDIDTATEKGLIGKGEGVEGKLADNKKRAALNVSMWGDGELKGAVTDGNLMAISDIVGRINRRTWGEGWEAAQRAAFYELDGLDATSRMRALEMMQAVQPFVRSGEINWRELGETARYYAAHYDELKAEGISVNGLPGFDLVTAKMSDDSISRVPVETKDGEITTVADVDAKRPHEVQDVPGVRSAFEPPREIPGLELRAAEGGGQGNVFGCTAFPDMKVTVGGDLYSIQGVTPASLADPRNRQAYATIFGKIFEQAKAANERLRAEWEKNGRKGPDGAVTEEPPKVLIDFPPECERQVNFLLDWYDHSVKVDPKMQPRTDAVLKLLEKSGLASGVVADQEQFDAALSERGFRKMQADGLTYGWTDGDKVFLNPKFFGTLQGLDTPIHEFGHLGIIATKKVNRPLYDRGIELAKKTGLFKEISEHPDYAKDAEDKRAEEVLTRIIASRGSDIDASTPKGVVAEIRKWVAEFWASLGKRLGIRDLTPEQIAKMATVEDVADAIRAEMMTGRAFGTGELSLAAGDVKAKILRFSKYRNPNGKAAKESFKAVKDAWRNLSEEEKARIGEYGDTDVLKSPEAKRIAGMVERLRSWDAQRKKMSEGAKRQARKNPNAGQQKIITGSPEYYVANVTEDMTSPFAFVLENKIPIPQKGDFGYDAWRNLTDGMDKESRRELARFFGGKYYKHGGTDLVMRDYAEFLGMDLKSADEFELKKGAGLGDEGQFEQFLADVMAEKAKFEEWRAGDRKTRAEMEEERLKAEAEAGKTTSGRQQEGGMTDEEFAAEDAWVKAAEANRVEAERRGEQNEIDDMPDFSRPQQPIMLSRGGTKLDVNIDFSNPEDVKSFKKFVKDLPSADMPARLKDPRPQSVFAWYEENMVGKTFSFDIPGFGHREFKPAPGHIGKLVCAGGNNKDGTPIVKGRIKKAKGKDWRQMVKNGEVKSSDVEGWDQARARSLPLIPELLQKFDFVLHETDVENRDILIFAKKFTSKNGRPNTIVMRVIDDGKTIGPISTHVKDLTAKWLKNKDLVVTNDNEIYGRGEDNSANRSPTPTDNAEGNSVGTGDTIPKSVQDGKGEIMLARPQGVDRSLLVFGRTRVAEDAGRGEMTPGSLAASRELATQRPTPIQNAGRMRKLSLTLSDMEWARKFLTGNVVPAHIAKRLPGGANSASTKGGKLVIAADVFGMIDKTDRDVNKNFLKQHGYFQNEDPAWCAGRTDAQIAQERRRSEEQLANQLDTLRQRRVDGREPGGESAARSIFVDELANIVMEMKHVPANGTAAAVRTIGDGLRSGLLAANTVDAIRDEAGQFLDWAYGAPAAGQPATRDLPAEQLTNRMFGAYLVMPHEIETRAPAWSVAINDIIAGDAKLLDAWQRLSERALSEQSFGPVQRQMMAALSRQNEILIRKMEGDVRKPISAGSLKADAKEQLLVGFHDRMAPIAVRIDEKVRLYRAAKKEALKLARTPAEKARISQELSRFIGTVDDAVNRMKLSRLAFERGASNEGMVYFIREKMLLDEATERQDLTLEDIALYMDNQRGIETQGRANSFGVTPAQNRLMLQNMKLRLGNEKYHALEVFSQKWHAVHEQEFLDDPRLQRAFGKDYVDYLKTQTHYVTVARTWSPEELAGIEAARAAARRAGVAGGDDVIDSMFKFAGHNGMGSGEGIIKARMTGSFADKKNVIAATMDKVDRSLKFLRRNQYVIDMRDALLAAGVEGVRDVARGGGEFPKSSRYGHLNYMENGRRRTLVVPKQIADAFEHDQSAMRLYSKCYGVWRKSIIDWNAAYWNRNIARNSGSIEKNMPGVRESYVKMVLRPFGLGNFADTMCQHLVRHAPAASRLFGDDTIFGFIPKAKRLAAIRDDPSKFEQQLWRAMDAGDAEAVATLQGDLNDLFRILKTNALAPVRSAYRNQDVGFVDDVLGQKSLKTIQRIREEAAARSKKRKALDAATWVFRRTAQQQMFEDDLAKITAYLHDRVKYGGVRTEKETGLMVAENVSIGQGERSGTLKRGIQGTIATFFNMVEKGIVRNVKAHMDRPGEMIAKDAKVWTGTLVGGLLTTGVISWAIRRMFDDDENKIAESPLALPYQYAEFWRRAAKNRSTYMKENCNCVPIWMSPTGKTTLDIRMPYNDEDKLIVPGAQFAAEMIAAKCGIGTEPSLMHMIKRSTLDAITPDLALSGPLWMLLRDTVWSLFSNPEDYFTGRELYDKDLHENRFASMDMAGKFAASMGLQLWNDLGGRVVYQPDRQGIEGDRSETPTLDVVLSKLPVVSPFIKSFLSVQTGDIDKYAKPLTEAEEKRASLIRLLRKEAKKESTPDQSWYMRDPEGFKKQLGKWTETYKLTSEEVMDLRDNIAKDWLEMGPLEGVNTIEKRIKFRDKARQQGIDPRYITD